MVGSGVEYLESTIFNMGVPGIDRQLTEIEMIQAVLDGKT